uniref:protein HEG-like n=1 Tax=Ciona intestinalis TaxID=7719 RepID=UPI000EF46819|nr:protein HEG-like [Ciona intestinalis]|eukprot:XP_026692606.1 protein HEG-like [Ciona intestinalis]
MLRPTNHLQPLQPNYQLQQAMVRPTNQLPPLRPNYQLQPVISRPNNQLPPLMVVPVNQLQPLRPNYQLQPAIVRPTNQLQPVMLAPANHVQPVMLRSANQLQPLRPNYQLQPRWCDQPTTCNHCGTKQPTASSDVATSQAAATTATKQPAVTTSTKLLPATSDTSTNQPVATTDGATNQPAATSNGATNQPAATSDGATNQPAATSNGATNQPAATSDGATNQPAATSNGATNQPAVTTESSSQSPVVIDPTTAASSTEDINECLDQPQICSIKPGSYCSDLTNGYTCICKPPQYESNGVCVSGLQFGGKLKISIAGKRKKRAVTQQTVEEILTQSYANSSGFVSVTATSSSDETIWNYQLFYSAESNVNSSYISNWFSDYLTEQNCNVDTTEPCSIGGIQVVPKTSVAAAGNAGDVVCEANKDYCDVTSTQCQATGGTLSCVCSEGFYTMPGNERYCEAKICITNSHCNGPNGVCVVDPATLAPYCSCNFGFSGQNCNDAWLLVFVIFACCIGGILILVAVFCFWRKRKTAKSKSYSNDVWMNAYNELEGAGRTNNAYESIEQRSYL